MKSVLAKFCIQTLTEDIAQQSVIGMAVHGDEADNKDFTKYTPAGELKIEYPKEHVFNSFFHAGHDFYIQFFSEAPEDKPGTICVQGSCNAIRDLGSMKEIELYLPFRPEAARGHIKVSVWTEPDNFGAAAEFFDVLGEYYIRFSTDRP